MLSVSADCLLAMQSAGQEVLSPFMGRSTCRSTGRDDVQGLSSQESVRAHSQQHLAKFWCSGWRRMRRKVEKNATSLARRFRNLAGLKLLLLDEMRALELAKRKAMSVLDEIAEACSHRPQTLVEQASTPQTCSVS